MRKLIQIATLFACLTGAASARAQAWGSWDSFSSTTVVKGSDVTVNGWALDGQSGASGLVANVYIDGGWGTQQPVGNVARPDVASAWGHPEWTNCGFAASLSTANLSVGSHTIDIWLGGGPSGWNHFTTSIVNGSTFSVTPPPPPVVFGSTWWWHDLWPGNDGSQSPNATNGLWTAQYDFVADPTADAAPDLSASSSTLATLSQTGYAWGEIAFGPDFGGWAVNTRFGMHTHPNWAMDKTFTAPVKGWYHIHADGVVIEGCGDTTLSDGALLEVYKATPSGQTRLWAELLTPKTCDGATISINEYLNAGERLIIRGSSHTWDNYWDGIFFDPYVSYQGDEAQFRDLCVTELSSAGTSCNKSQTQDWASDACDDIRIHDYMYGSGADGVCSRREIRLVDDTYHLYGAAAEAIQAYGHDVTVRGDYAAGGVPRSTKAKLIMHNRAKPLFANYGDHNELRGVEIDYATDALPFTQGTVRSVGGNNVHVQIDPGYRDDLPYTDGVAIDANDHHRTYVNFDAGAFTDANGYWTLPVAQTYPSNTMPVAGDRIAIMARGAGGTIIINGYDNALTDVTMRAAAGLAVVAGYNTTSGLQIRRFTIAPAAGRLISTNGDGLHLKNLVRGATVEDSDYSGMADDAINNHADCSNSPSGCNANAGPGLLVRGTKFHDHRGRGLLAQGPYNLITGNSFWNLSRMGIASGDSVGGSEGPADPYQTFVRHNCLASSVDYGGESCSTGAYICFMNGFNADADNQTAVNREVGNSTGGTCN